MAQGDAEHSPNEILVPRNFLAFTGAGLKLFRPVGGRAFLVYASLIGLLYAALVSIAYLSSSVGSRALSASYSIAEVVIPPLVGSLLLAKTAPAMIAGFVGRDSSLLTGRSTRQTRSHVLAAAMLSTFLVFAIGFAMGPLGFFVGSHVLLGPPLLAHVISLENLSFTDGWARTKELLGGQALRTFLYLLCLALILVLVEQIVLGVIYSLVQSALSLDTPELIFYPALGLVLGGGMSLMSAFLLESYLELRARHEEDFDVEDLANELEEDEDFDEDSEAEE